MVAKAEIGRKLQRIAPARIPCMRFTIRDLMWLTVVVAMAIGWLCDRRILANRESSLKAEKLLAQERAQVTYAEYEKVMRLIKESGHALVWHTDGTTTLEKSN